MNPDQGKTNTFFVGFYAWIVTVSFGAALLDTVYSRSLPGASAAFSEVSDFLLLVSFVALLASVVAVAFSWSQGSARNYFIASLLILLFEFFVPLFLSPFITDTPGPGWTASLRILIHGAASILAWIGLHQFYRSSP